MTNDDALTRTTSVPNWMIQLALWMIGALSAGAVATLVSVVNWGFWLQSEQGRIEAQQKADIGLLRAEMAAAKVKQDDHSAMLSSINKTVNDLDRKFDRLEARMPP
jgi:hypothetical protein